MARCSPTETHERGEGGSEAPCVDTGESTGLACQRSLADHGQTLTMTVDARPPPMGNILIHRKVDTIDKDLVYDVYVDGHLSIGRTSRVYDRFGNPREVLNMWALRDGATVDLGGLFVGTHRLVIRLDRRRSNEVEFYMLEGTFLHFECYPRGGSALLRTIRRIVAPRRCIVCNELGTSVLPSTFP